MTRSRETGVGGGGEGTAGEVGRIGRVNNRKVELRSMIFVTGLASSTIDHVNIFNSTDSLRQLV